MWQDTLIYRATHNNATLLLSLADLVPEETVKSSLAGFKHLGKAILIHLLGRFEERSKLLNVFFIVSLEREKAEPFEEEIWRNNKEAARCRCLAGLVRQGFLWGLSGLRTRYVMTPLGVAAARHLRNLNTAKRQLAEQQEEEAPQEDLEGWEYFPAIERQKKGNDN